MSSAAPKDCPKSSKSTCFFLLGLVQELVICGILYPIALISQYLLDIAILLLNSYVLARSFSRTTGIPFGHTYSQVVETVKRSIPLPVISISIDWFSSTILKATSFFSKLSFTTFMEKAFQVTCMGAKSSGEALNNVLLAIVVYLLFDIQIFEMIKVRGSCEQQCGLLEEPDFGEWPSFILVHTRSVAGDNAWASSDCQSSCWQSQVQERSCQLLERWSPRYTFSGVPLASVPNKRALLMHTRNR